MATIRPEDAREWVRLRDEIRRIEQLNVPAAKAREEARKAAIEGDLHQLKIQAANYKREAVKHQKGIDKLEKRGVARVFSKVTGTLDDKISKNQDGNQRALESYEAKVGQIEARQAELNEVASVLSRIYIDQSSLNGLREQQKSLMGRVFKGVHGAGDAFEKHLQGEVDVLAPDVEKNKKRTQTYEQAVAHMRKGTAACGKAVQLLQQASKLCAADIAMNFQRRPAGRGGRAGPMGRGNPGLGNMMVDRRKHQFLRGATQTLQAAAAEVLTAKGYVPEITPIDPNLVKTMSPFLDVMFDSMMIDIVVAKQVKDSLRRTEATYEHLQKGLAWLEKNQRAVEMKYSALKGNRDGKKEQLKRYRVQLFEAAGANRAPYPTPTPTPTPIPHTYPTPSPTAATTTTTTTHGLLVDLSTPTTSMYDSLSPPPAYAPYGGMGTGAYDPFSPTAPTPPAHYTNTNPFVPPPSPSFPHYPYAHPASAPTSPRLS